MQILMSFPVFLGPHIEDIWDYYVDLERGHVCPLSVCLSVRIVKLDWSHWLRIILGSGPMSSYFDHIDFEKFRPSCQARLIKLT